MTEIIIREYSVGEFRGDFPNVDIAPGVDMDALKELDANPFFATLPIVPEVGAVSGNGLLYDEELVGSIERQINENRPGGIFGHLKETERDTAFPLPSGIWVGAKRIANTLWAKVYCPPGVGREHLRTLKALGGEIATSIYGKATRFEKVSEGVKRAVDFKLESLDFAPPSRAALRYGAVPHLTTEMETSQEVTMADKSEVIKELRDVTVPPNKGWVAPQQPVQETEEAMTEVIEMATIREALGVPEGMNVVEFVSELREQVDQMRQERVDAHIAELVSDGIKLAPVRGIVTKFVRALSPKTVEEANAAYEQVVEMEEVKELLALTAKSLSGPATIVSGKVQASGRKPLEDTPENRKRAAAEMGLSI